MAFISGTLYDRGPREDLGSMNASVYGCSVIVWGVGCWEQRGEGYLIRRTVSTYAVMRH